MKRLSPVNVEAITALAPGTKKKVQQLHREWAKWISSKLLFGRVERPVEQWSPFFQRAARMVLRAAKNNAARRRE
jgi:hypothetical protein